MALLAMLVANIFIILKIRLFFVNLLRIVFLHLLIFNKFLIFGQNQKLPHSLESITLGYRNDKKNEELNNFQLDRYKLSKIEVDKLDSTNQSLYWFKKSACHLFLKLDSAENYLMKALELKPKTICNISLRMRKRFCERIKSGELPQNMITYFDLIKSNYIDSMDIFCGKYKNDYTSNNSSQVRDSSEFEKQIRNNDLYERRKIVINWSIQNRKDSINRILVDSAYTIRKKILHFTPEEQDAITFVMHHSNDLVWVKKWFIIWLDELTLHDDKIKGGILLGPAFKRFQEYPEDKMTKEDIENMKTFFKSLRKKYSKELCDRFDIGVE